MRSWKGTQPEQLTQIDQRDILCHVTLCSAIKDTLKEEEGGEDSKSVKDCKRLFFYIIDSKFAEEQVQASPTRQ